MADRHRGLGILLKVADGNPRAVAPARVEILRQLGGWHDEVFESIHNPILRNHGGPVVGRIETRITLQRG